MRVHSIASKQHLHKGNLTTCGQTGSEQLHVESQRRVIMTYNFLSPPNRFKPREFKEYSLQPQSCLTKLKCKTDSLIS